MTADQVAHQLLLNGEGISTHRPSKAKITSGTQGNGMAKRDNEQHPCVEEVSRAVAKSKVIAILKRAKTPPYLRCHCCLNKLFERMILNRLNPITEHTIIKEQAGFRAGKSCTSQLVNMTQYIEDGYKKSLTTGTVFVELSAAYDTVNHRVLLTTLYGMIEDAELSEV